MRPVLLESRNLPVQTAIPVKPKKRPYLNETGPGDYELPALTGPAVPDKRSGPAFSFGVKRTAHFISKEYLKVKAYTLRVTQNFQG